MTKNKTRVRSGLVVLFLHSKLLRKFTTSLALGWLSYGRSWRSRLKSSWAPCSSMAASAVPDGLPPARSLCCSTVPLLGSLTRCIGFKNKTFQCSCILCTLYFFNSKKSFLKIWQIIVSWIFPLLKSISQFLQEKPSLHDKGVLLKLWTIKIVSYWLHFLLFRRWLHLRFPTEFLLPDPTLNCKSQNFFYRLNDMIAWKLKNKVVIFR